jgi:hypothetical protein
MTRGLGLSIGSARAIAVSLNEDGTSTVSRRSTLTFGIQSTVRLGDDPSGEGVVVEFAHRPGEPTDESEPDAETAVPSTP